MTILPAAAIKKRDIVDRQGGVLVDIGKLEDLSGDASDELGPEKVFRDRLRLLQNIVLIDVQAVKDASQDLHRPPIVELKDGHFSILVRVQVGDDEPQIRIVWVVLVILRGVLWILGTKRGVDEGTKHWPDILCQQGTDNLGILGKLKELTKAATLALHGSQ